MTALMQFPLRIIHVVNVRWFNATAWYGLTLAKLMSDAGHEVHVLALADTDAFRQAQKLGLNPESCNLNSQNPLIIGRTFRQITKLVSKFRPHVVNCHRGEGVFLWAMLKKLHPSFALVRTRGDQRQPKGNLPNRYLHNHYIDGLIATNSQTFVQFREVLKVPESHMAMIPGGVDTDIFYADKEAAAKVRSQYGFGSQDFVIGLLGRFDRVKGHKELIEAVKKAKAKSRQSVRLFFVGYPTDSVSENSLRMLLDSEGFSDAVIVAERADTAKNLINAMNLGVIASQGSEAIARAAFEIMACGVPVVGTDVGVMPDLLAPDVVAPLDIPGSLSLIMEKILSDRDFYETVRKEQKKRLPQFTKEAFLRQTLEAYQSFITQMPG